MGRPVIRVSEWALEELRRRAKEEGRTVVSVVDRLLGKQPHWEVDPADARAASSERTGQAETGGDG